MLCLDKCRHTCSIDKSSVSINKVNITVFLAKVMNLTLGACRANLNMYGVR